MVTFCFQLVFSIAANLIFVVAARNHPISMSPSLTLPHNICTLLGYHFHLSFNSPSLSSLSSRLLRVHKLLPFLPLKTPLLSSSSPLPSPPQPSYMLESSPLIRLPSSRLLQQVPSYYDLEISLLLDLMEVGFLPSYLEEVVL